MLVDIITMTAFGGAVLALIQWMTLSLVADDQPLAPCDASRRGDEEKQIQKERKQ